MQQPSSTVPASVGKQLEDLYVRLAPDEQHIVSEIVRAALLQAAEKSTPAHGHRAADVVVPEFVQAITGAHAPKLVASLRFPGPLAAHSIPGCNAAALVALRELKQ